MSRRSCCSALPIVAYVAGAAERINRMRQPARETFEAEATRLRDEPGLGRGGAWPIRPRPYRGVSGGGRARRSKISESEALSRGLGRDGAIGPLIPRLQEPILTPHVAMSLVQELGSTVVGNPCSVPSQMAGG